MKKEKRNALYHQLGEEYDITTQRVIIHDELIKIITAKKPGIEYYFKKINELYIEYINEYHGDIQKQVENIAAKITLLEVYETSTEDIEYYNDDLECEN